MIGWSVMLLFATKIENDKSIRGEMYSKPTVYCALSGEVNTLPMGDEPYIVNQAQTFSSNNFVKKIL